MGAKAGDWALCTGSELGDELQAQNSVESAGDFRGDVFEMLCARMQEAGLLAVKVRLSIRSI